MFLQFNKEMREISQIEENSVESTQLHDMTAVDTADVGFYITPYKFPLHHTALCSSGS